MMFLQVIILLAGFLFLVKGADWFVEGAASIAKKLWLSRIFRTILIKKERGYHDAQNER